MLQNFRVTAFTVFELLRENQIRVKRSILIVTTDCEEGNKKTLINFQKKKKKNEEKNNDPYLALTGPLSDAPHLTKSLKASFSNRYLTLFNECICLSFFIL